MGPKSAQKQTIKVMMKQYLTQVLFKHFQEIFKQSVQFKQIFWVKNMLRKLTITFIYFVNMEP